ncbi:phosphatidylinositol transfer protein vib isoform X2 [Rhipicephalus microplus]|uniref:phosphatidylinositol transfer protein vib isoform X2 n=1 Tax=Rhipicephalus microplus TaxID=6941 RepID=UPI003F6A90AD
MLIKEFRVVLPITVEEYQVAQLYSVAEASKNETGGGEGIEVIKNEPFEGKELLGGKYNKGQYTYKIYHLESKVPPFIRMLMPKGSLAVHEEAWNAYPYCRTVLTNPDYMAGNFTLCIETMHAPDNGTQENVHELPPEKLKIREVDVIDIASDPVLPKDGRRRHAGCGAGEVFLPVVSTAASASTTQTKINAITLPYQQLTHDQEPHVLNLSTPHDGASTASTMAIKGRLQQHPRSGHVGWHRNGVMSNPFLFFVQVFLPVVSTAASASTTQTKINAITLPYQQLTHDQEPHVLNLSTPHDGASTASTMAIKGRLQQHPRSGHVGWHRNGVMSNPFLFFVQDYKEDEDPSTFVSKKTGRGPLKGDWMKSCKPVMCAYKLVTVEFKWFGLQNRVEAFIQKTERRIFLNFHRQVFCWMDRWYGMTMADIRKLEEQTKKELDEQRKKGTVRGTKGEE